MRILIAEDDKVSRKLLEVHLKQFGYEIEISENGSEALAKLSEVDAPPLAILDWMMPDCDGVDICRAIRSQPDRPFLYIIMLTAKARIEDIVQALDAGADDYMVKPFDKGELRARVKAAERVIKLELSLQSKISDLKQAETILSQTIAQYSAMINTVPATMYLKNCDHQYIAVNRVFCEEADKSQNEILGKTDHDIFTQDVADKNHKMDQAVVDQACEIITNEEKVVDSRGAERWITAVRAPLCNSQGKVSGVAGLIRDVTEQHLSRGQLLQQDKLAGIGTLAAGVAHEINNPMGFITSNLNTMNKYLKKIRNYMNEPGDDDEREHISEIMTDFVDAIEESLEGADRVKKIVADLKSFSRVDRAKLEETDINEGIESTLNIIWNELKYHCQVEKELGDIPMLYCFPTQLNQVLMNLLLNAGQAITKDPGIIKIRTWSDDINIYVSIKDNGSGIPENKLKRIFEPFFTTKEVGKGTGLGLSLAYDIVKKHHGTIDVKTELGVGTEFLLSLPLVGIEKQQQQETCAQC